MRNRRIRVVRHFVPCVLTGFAVVVLAGWLLFAFEISAARLPERTGNFPIGISAQPVQAKSIASADDQKSRKKKKKYKSDDKSDGTRVRGARPVPPFEIPAAIPGKRYVYFTAMGDWGNGNKGQQQVAQLMNAKAGRDSLHFVLLLGDNFYDTGVGSVNDPQWQSKFETMYNLPFLNVPFFAVLGNHDYKQAASPAAQVEYSKRNTKWRMPARYYTFARALEAAAVLQFFALDTEAMITRKWYHFIDNQLDWLEDELKKSTATWKVVYGHHPIFSNGKHGNTQALQEQLRPLLEKYKVDFYLCGHDHDRQLLQPVNGVHYIVSGTGSESRDTAWADNTIFAGSDLGFVWCRVSTSEFHVQFINKNGEVEFAHTVTKTKLQSNGKPVENKQ
ncbi:MAG: tartrate-resistant acid phosphatase type 5 family protein [candidate division KSB1 bacterium]|nr:tartrate-resistant acid phosphatase type 5 family protein [candidate division KSB1 bacterium]MDZ7303810.1 tartrate-resistant acid phosphatase type 5 family protein [candidate division KSB1 bacterium]MDZ7314179.1 tartrate-resistant acid phosphatase type 5 family protein [candidate division KSB1 bacterium]